MALAQGNLVKTSYVVETVAGTTPAAALTVIPLKTSNINAAVNTTTSAEIRADRAVADLVRTTGNTAGDFGFELSFTDYDNFIESALGGTRSVAVALTALDISFSSVDNSINSAASAFSTANIVAGNWIKIKGAALAANNGIAKVVSIAAAKIIVSHKTFTTEAAGASVTVNAQSIRNGAVKKTFTVEYEYADLATTFSAHRGMQVNTMTMNAGSGAILEGTIGFMGRDSVFGTATVGTGAAIIPAATPIMSASANVGSIFVDGVALTGTPLKSINASFTNNTRQLDAVGNFYPVDINLGSFGATFAVQAYFSDSSLIAKFLAGTAVSLSYSFTDSLGNVIVIDAPNCKFNTGAISGRQLNSEVMQDLSLTALLSPTLGYQLQVSLLAA
jgi:hypothetical protein